jgi:hypothetical protein
VKLNHHRPTMTITGDGDGIVAHAGARLLVDVADGLGLTARLGERPTARRTRASAYDPGQVLRDVAVMIADGGDCLSDLAVLRDQPELFGRLPHEVTVWRLLDNVAADEFGVDAMRAARAFSRKQAWEQAAGLPLTDGMLVIDIDATEIGAHSDKQQAAGTYKGHFGFYPLLSYLDRGDGTGEPLAGVLRAGNAGSNTVIDHHDILQLTLDQLPVTPEQVPMLVRTDSAGASHGFVDALRQEAIMFSVGFPVDERVRNAVAKLPATGWVNAVTQDGDRREGAAVAELHTLDLSGWPAGARVIARREPAHPGAQQGLFDVDGYRITCFLTDQPDADIVELDRRHRARMPAWKTVSVTPKLPG